MRAVPGSGFLITYGSHWLDAADDNRHRAWTRAAVRALATHGMGGGYTNFDTERTAAGARTFPAATHRRLVALKRTYDPDNVFHHNVNIDPDGGRRRDGPRTVAAATTQG